MSFDCGRDAAELERRLFKHGVVVRPMAGYGLPHTLRVSVGSEREVARFTEGLA